MTVTPFLNFVIIQGAFKQRPNGKILEWQSRSGGGAGGTHLEGMPALIAGCRGGAALALSVPVKEEHWSASGGSPQKLFPAEGSEGHEFDRDSSRHRMRDATDSFLC